MEDVPRWTLSLGHFDILIFKILLHVEQQLKEELTDAQILANHLTLVDGLDVFQI